MRVTFHGVRGSIATPGRATMRYGGNTVCVEVRTADNTLIILDAGTGIRELGKQLLAADRLPDPIHIFITHSHWDHIIGAPFFGPLWRREAHVMLHALSESAYNHLARNVLFDGEHFPVLARDIPAHVERPPFVGDSVRIGSARVSRIPLNHPGGADGFRIDDADGASMCYLTDNELQPPGAVRTSEGELARFAAGTGLLVHDAQYLQSDLPAKHGWGHSLVPQVLALGRAAEARALVLHHHDPDRDDDALDRIGADSAAWAAQHAPGMKTLVATEGTSHEIAPD
jgi:phosphoribosyl 1,2-cyclic phosphodiesterase